MLAVDIEPGTGALDRDAVLRRRRHFELAIYHLIQANVCEANSVYELLQEGVALIEQDLYAN